MQQASSNILYEQSFIKYTGIANPITIEFDIHKNSDFTINVHAFHWNVTASDYADPATGPEALNVLTQFTKGYYDTSNNQTRVIETIGGIPYVPTIFNAANSVSKRMFHHKDGEAFFFSPSGQFMEIGITDAVTNNPISFVTPYTMILHLVPIDKQ